MDFWQLPKAKKKRGKILPQNLQRQYDPFGTSILDSSSPEARENTFFVILSHPVCDILLWEPQQANIVGYQKSGVIRNKINLVINRTMLAEIQRSQKLQESHGLHEDRCCKAPHSCLWAAAWKFGFSKQFSHFFVCETFPMCSLIAGSKIIPRLDKNAVTLLSISLPPPPPFIHATVRRSIHLHNMEGKWNRSVTLNLQASMD